MRYRVVPNADGTAFEVWCGNPQDPKQLIVDGFDTKDAALLFVRQLLIGMIKVNR